MKYVGEIAEMAHEVNRAYCQAIGDNSHLPWSEAPEWQQATILKGVEFHLSQDRTPAEAHQSWWDQKVADGWVYGEEKDPVAKTHPWMIPYDHLPENQRVKDYLFKAVVQTAKRFRQS